jgi:hypothetical protein
VAEAIAVTDPTLVEVDMTAIGDFPRYVRSSRLERPESRRLFQATGKVGSHQTGKSFLLLFSKEKSTSF